MSDHSPGPWQWGTHDGVTKLYDADGRVVATGDYHKGVTVQGAGNRDLIASVPSLLAERDELREALRVAAVTIKSGLQLIHGEICNDGTDVDDCGDDCASVAAELRDIEALLSRHPSQPVKETP